MYCLGPSYVTWTADHIAILHAWDDGTFYLQWASYLAIEE